MDEKDNGSGELGSVFGSILDATDKSAEDLASLAAGNGGIVEIEIPDTAPDNGNGLAFEDTISGDISDSSQTERNDGTGIPAASEVCAGGAFSTEEKNADEVKPFQPKKMSARDAMSRKKTPQTLNKQLILYCIVGIAAFAVIIFPFLTKKRVKSASERPVASEIQVTDYSKLVESYGKGKSDLDEKPEPKEKIPQKTDEEIMNSLPPGSGDEGCAGNPYAKFGLPADKNAYARELLGQYNQSNNLCTAE